MMSAELRARTDLAAAIHEMKRVKEKTEAMIKDTPAKTKKSELMFAVYEMNQAIGNILTSLKRGGFIHEPV